MPQAIVIRKTGGPEELRLEELREVAPGPGQILVAHTAIGINYIDVYHRSGLYPLPKLPAILGTEAAGDVLAVGPGVTHVQPGDRVAYATGPLGAYREQRVISADIAIKLPDHISNEVAASVLLKGLTAHFLIRRAYVVIPGTPLLIHAAAGGVGLILTQWAKQAQAMVIGTVGTEEKEAIAKAHGCDHVINYRKENFVTRVMEITEGKGVAVVYDSVGKDTFFGSLDCLMTFGTMVSFGQSSGPVPPVNLSLLAKKSLFLTRPRLQDYKADPLEIAMGAGELFELIRRDLLKVTIGARYSLEQAAQAHQDLEARKTIGSSIFVV